MALSTRLQTIASLVNEGANVADIGADHGLLSIYLVEKGLVNSVFAVENKIGPYQTLVENTKNYPSIKTSLSDGLDELPEDVNSIVIAGMGGLLITDILGKNKDKLKRVSQIVVDAHRDIEQCGLFLEKVGFYPTDIHIVHEKVYYLVINFTRKKLNKSVDELAQKDPLFKEYKKHLLGLYTRNYAKNHSQDLQRRMERLKQL